MLFTGLVIFLDFGAPLPSTRQAKDTAGPSTRPRLSALLNPVLIWFSVVSFLHHAFEYGHTYWFVTYAAPLPGIGVDKARDILIGFLSGIIVSRMVLSWLAARDIMRQVLSVAVAIALALIVFMPEYTEYPQLYVANVAFGVAVGVVFPSLLAIVVSTSDSHGAMFSSAGLISGALGTQFAAVLLGAVIQMGAAREIYTVLALVGLGLLVCVNLLVRSCTPTSEPAREEMV
ncbi:MFS transporter [Agrobacterium sp. 22-226-1]